MHTLAGQGVEKDREGRHEGLSFSGCHLGDLTLMKDYTTDKLDIIMHHIPGDLVSACHPVVLPQSIIAVNGHELLGCTEIAVKISSLHLDYRILLETAGCRFHDCKCLR